MRLNNRLFQKLYDLDFKLLMLVTLIAIIGFVMMYSAAQGNFEPWASKQIIHFLLGMSVLLFIPMINISFWYKYAYFFYGVSLFLIILTELTGHTAMGATRWFKLGPIKLQPSEPIKICLVLALARYFHNLQAMNVKKIIYLIPPVLMVLVPVAIIIKQPDLGTAMIILMLGGIIFFASGVEYWKFGVVILIGMLAMPIAWKFMYDYQKQRVLVFLDPGRDKWGSGYNIIQSKIAIGSGGFWGKGLVKGSQSQLNFLPEHQTDFIFTMLSEELGFAGGVTVLFLYALIIMYSYQTAINCHNHFGQLVSIGVASTFFLHVFINIAMVMGLIPAVGVPLPLLTYGGTIMISILFGFGLLMSARIHSRPFDRNIF